MRTKEEIEEDREKNIEHRILELLLDIRDLLSASKEREE